jgi:hypothetical protein
LLNVSRRFERKFRLAAFAEAHLDYGQG